MNSFLDIKLARKGLEGQGSVGSRIRAGLIGYSVYTPWKMRLCLAEIQGDILRLLVPDTSLPLCASHGIFHSYSTLR